MEVKAATSCFQWSQNATITHSPSSSQTLASAFSSSSFKRRRVGGESPRGSLACHYTQQKLHGTTLFGYRSTKICRSRSCDLGEYSKASNTKTTSQRMRRVCSASLDSFSGGEVSKKSQELPAQKKSHELSLKFHISDAEDGRRTINKGSGQEIIHDLVYSHAGCDEFSRFHIQEPGMVLDSVDSPWHELVHDAQIERKANSVALPLSLRIIKKKMQLEDGFRDAGESAHCSVKKAFSSMVLMIVELHRVSLQMEGLLCYEDLRGSLCCVQKEMHSSFVWLFQQVFSQTPTLMVYVMVLLANFTVHDMGSKAAKAAALPPPAMSEMTSIAECLGHINQKFVSSAAEAASNGDGKVLRVTSGTDDHTWSDVSNHFRTFFPGGATQLLSFWSSSSEAESVSGQESREEELSTWNSIMDEVELKRDEVLDSETMRRFISRVDGSVKSNDDADYFRTELLYQTGVAQDPNNPLLLTNYAQLLYQVYHDYDRAEEYFEQAISIEPVDPETYSKYATFLWRARNDLWRAEETYLEAISADPTNSYYAANYAHFLWNTGGEETCFPLGSSDTP